MNSTADYADFTDIFLGSAHNATPVSELACHVRRPRRTFASQSFDQLIVSLVVADPKPFENIAGLSRERAVMITDANTPDVLAQRHELERGVTGIVRKQLKFFVRQSLGCARQLIVASPEGFARDVPHARLKPCVTLPDAMSASSCSSNGRRRPASMSSIICRSHESVFPSNQSLSSSTSSAGSDSISFFTPSSCGLTHKNVARLSLSGKRRRNQTGPTPLSSPANHANNANGRIQRSFRIRAQSRLPRRSRRKAGDSRATIRFIRVIRGSTLFPSLPSVKPSENIRVIREIRGSVSVFYGSASKSTFWLTASPGQASSFSDS
jgi:hypothetical protein